MLDIGQSNYQEKNNDGEDDNDGLQLEVSSNRLLIEANNEIKRRERVKKSEIK
jgi:hypothetical protein